MNEASKEGWTTHTLDRNISSLYYYRLLQSPKKDKVLAEIKELTLQFQQNKNECIKSPVIAEFLGLSTSIDFTTEVKKVSAKPIFEEYYFFLTSPIFYSVILFYMP